MSKLITIKDGRRGPEFSLKVLRSDLLSVDQTHDGITFQIKTGIQFYVYDMNMPNSTKEVITNSINNFLDRDLEVDLANYRKPVSILIEN